MLKKVLLALLAVLLILTLVACNKDEDPENKDGDDTTPPATTGDDEPTLTKSGELEGTDIVWEVYSDHTMYVKCKGTHAATEPCSLPDFEKLQGIENKTNQPWWENGGKSATDRPTDGGATTVTKLVIGEGITALGDYAFMDMKLLEEVVLPSTLKEISYQSFFGCPKLKTVKGGFGVTLIDSGAFASCTVLETIELSPVLTEVAENAFADVAKSGKKLTVKIKGTADEWETAVETMRTTENALGFPCLAEGNDAFETATVEYVQ